MTPVCAKILKRTLHPYQASLIGFSPLKTIFLHRLQNESHRMQNLSSWKQKDLLKMQKFHLEVDLYEHAGTGLENDRLRPTCTK